MLHLRLPLVNISFYFGSPDAIVRPHSVGLRLITMPLITSDLVGQRFFDHSETHVWIQITLWYVLAFVCASYVIKAKRKLRLLHG